MGDIFREEVLRRFESKVDRLGDCHLWLGKPNRRGYGAISVDGRRIGAHRYALMIALERELKPGFCALHKCHNPPCVNADHLYEGTKRNNFDDMRSRGTYTRNRARGSGARKSELSEADVIAIREACSSGKKQRDVAKQYGISQPAVSKIHRREHWGHL